MTRQVRSVVLVLAVAVGLLATAVSASAAEKAGASEKPAAKKKIKVVVLTGGHGFDGKKFPLLFAGYDDIEAKLVALKDHSEIFEDIAEWPYDVIVMYNLTQRISEKRRKNFVALLDRGVGLVVLHHAFASYLGWAEFKKIAGVRFYLRKMVEDGVTHNRSGASHVKGMKVHIEDPKHPITAGMKDFTLDGEPYRNQWFAKDNHVLVTTDHRASDKVLAFVRTYRKARVYGIQPGHGPAQYADKSFRRLIAQGIRWTARRIGKEDKAPAKKKGAEAEKGATGVTEAPPDPTAAVAKIKTYTFGQSRKDLLAAEKIIRASAAKPPVRASLRRALVALLGSDATQDAKAWACKQLRLIGRAEDVPAVAKLLTDEGLSHMARSALESIPGPEAAKALREALVKVQGRTLVGVVNSLANRRDAEAVGPLAKLVGSGDKEVAAAAVHALGAIGGDEAAATLGRLASSVPAALRPAVVDARLQIAESLLAAGSKDQAAKIYEGLFKPKQAPRHVLAAALAGVVATRGAKSVPTLVEMLIGDDPALQALAATHVRSIPGAEAVRTFAAQLPKLPPSGQVALIRALAARKDPAGRADVARAVVRAAGGKDASVRLAALKALAVVGDASAVKLLIAAAVGDNAAEAAAARAGLYRLRGADVDAGITACLADAAPKVRLEAIRALSARRATGAGAALLKAAEDKDATVASEALKALAVLGDEQALPALVRLMLGAKDAGRRSLAGRAFEAVTKRLVAKGSDKDKAAAPLLAELPKADPAVKVTLLKVLGRIGGAKALAAIRTAAKDADGSVQDAAVRALVGWQTPEACGHLLAIARGSENQTHRVLALRAYVRLIGAAVRPAAETVKMYKAAMETARRVEDKRLILGGLGGRDDLASLDLAGEYFAQKDVQAEAFAAALKIASACSGTYPKQVQAAMAGLIAATKDEAVRKQAKAIIEETKGQLRIAVNIASEGKATSPDDLAKDGGAGGDAAAIDGDPVTYWDEQNGAKLYRLVVTFDQPRGVSGISILGYRQHDYSPKDFDVLCDGKAATAVRGAKYDANFLVVVFGETQCKAVELKITGYYGASPAIRELGIYGRKALGVTSAQLKRRRAQKVKQLPNGAWIVRDVPK